MSDPREGLKLRLGYEVAREIERTPIIALGVQDAATKAINSVLYQRLQDQVTDDNPTTRVNEERIRDINITNIALKSMHKIIQFTYNIKHPQVSNINSNIKPT